MPSIYSDSRSCLPYAIAPSSLYYLTRWYLPLLMIAPATPACSSSTFLHGHGRTFPKLIRCSLRLPKYELSLLVSHRSYLPSHSWTKNRTLLMAVAWSCLPYDTVAPSFSLSFVVAPPFFVIVPFFCMIRTFLFPLSHGRAFLAHHKPYLPRLADAILGWCLPCCVGS